MAQLKKDNWLAPFFGKSNDYSTGRDPLGLQTTSQATYATLLQGLTNLTNRIRYYGFYCWLLEMYACNIGDTNPKEQNKFMRRGEYLLALIMQLHEKESLQIAGSLFATEEVDKHKGDNEFDIHYAADVEKGKTTYWKYSSGAFGQYYAGAMQTIGLITQRDDSPVFICTESENPDIVTGTTLAKAFGNNISSEAIQLYLKIIDEGKLHKADSKKLYDEFSLSKIPINTEEWEQYNRMLFTNDLPLFQSEDNKTHFRRDTMLTVLSYLNSIENPNKWSSFTRELYNRKGKDFNGVITNSSYGWYYFQLNEYWHFGVETIFWAVLETLSSNYFQVSLSNFLDDFHKTFQESLKRYEFIDDEKQTLKSVIENNEIDDVWLIAQDILKSLRAKDSSYAIYLGFKLLLTIFKQNQQELDELRRFAMLNGMERDGDCIRGLKEFEYNDTINISDSIKKFVLKNIINRHLEVAYRKMGSGVKNTLKFSYEDNMIRHVETVYPVWTTPRIYAMYSFFKDMGYINPDGSISSIGVQIFKN